LNDGGRAPIWFVADPLRSDLALIDHQGPRAAYRWGLRFPILLGGVRPSEMDWYVFDRPGWYLGEGWAVTPETAGISDTGSYGRGRAPAQGWILRRSQPVTLMVGGRNFAGDGTSAILNITIDGRPVGQQSVPPGFFLRMMPVALEGPGDYATLAIETRGEVAIEQFDAQPPERVVFGYGDGWNERELDSSTGKLWRWMSDRGELRVRSTGQRMRLTLAGVTETFSKPSHVTIRVGDRIVAEQEAGESFSIRAEIPADRSGGEQVVTIETDQVYVPAERSARTADRRRLGLKVFECTLEPLPGLPGLSGKTEQ
jgi:hypothetical protein